MDRSGARIALVINRFDGRCGGAQLWTRGFAAWLANRNCDVHVLARSIGDVEARLPLTLHTIRSHRSPLEFAKAVSRQLAEIRPLLSHDMGAGIGCDVFHPHVGSPLACWAGSVASCPAWYRPVKRLSAFSMRYRRIRRMTRLQFGAGSQIYIALSQKVSRDLQRLHNVPAEQIRIAYNGVDLDRFAPTVDNEARYALRQTYGVEDHEVLILAVAHHFRLKGIPVLLRAIHQLRNQGEPVKLLICGGTKHSSRSRRLQDGAILHCGNVDDMGPLYAAADICAHPTFYDACSLVTLEALAAGLPLVTTRANGASELITPGVDGIVLDSAEDASALVTALRMLIHDDDLRRSLGAAGRTLAQQHSAASNYYEIARAYADFLAIKTGDSTLVEPLLADELAPGH